MFVHSLVLLASTVGSEAPQGLLFNRGSCTGTSPIVQTMHTVRERISVRAHSTGCTGAVRAPVRSVIQSWHFPIITAVRSIQPLQRSTGCTGSLNSYQKVVTRTNAPVGFSPMPQPTGPEVKVEELGQRITHAAVHRQLRVALRSDTLTPAQAAVARQALNDPLIYEAAVRKVHTDLQKAKFSNPAGTQAVFGDGTILKLLLDNLPAIIDAVLKIIAALG